MTEHMPTSRAVSKLVAIGGGSIPFEVSQTMVTLSGGPGARVVVCPLASEEADTGSVIAERRFKIPHGVRDVKIFDFAKPEAYARDGRIALIPQMRAYANTDEACAVLDESDLFYFSGGDQRVILNTLRGTRFAERLLDRWRAGHLVVAGTSAGLQVQSELAFTGDLFSHECNSSADAADNPCGVIARGVVELVPGLGFLHNVILDQHFLARRRQNRLFSAVLENPGFIGIGVDEGTALVLVGESGQSVVPQVIGRSGAFFIDGTSLQCEDGPDGRLVSATGFDCGVVWSGGTFPKALHFG